MVGLPGRTHIWDKTSKRWTYRFENSCDYSMVLTGAAFFHRVSSRSSLCMCLSMYVCMCGVYVCVFVCMCACVCMYVFVGACVCVCSSSLIRRNQFCVDKCAVNS